MRTTAPDVQRSELLLVSKDPRMCREEGALNLALGSPHFLRVPQLGDGVYAAPSPAASRENADARRQAPTGVTALAAAVESVLKSCVEQRHALAPVSKALPARVSPHSRHPDPRSVPFSVPLSNLRPAVRIAVHELGGGRHESENKGLRRQHRVRRRGAVHSRARAGAIALDNKGRQRRGLVMRASHREASAARIPPAVVGVGHLLQAGCVCVCQENWLGV